MRLPTDLEAFAAQQSDALARMEESLEGSARVALRHYGAAGWYNGLLGRVERALRAHFRSKSGTPTSPALRIAIVEFRRHAEASLKKTKRPPEDEIGVRAKALATSLATAAMNAAVIAAGRTDGRPRLSKVWHSMEDAAVRPTHAAANGQKVALRANFTVGGHSMSRPGDLRAPVEEWINCRCVLAVVDDTDVPLVAAAAAVHGVEMALLNQAETHGGAMDTDTETLAVAEDEGILPAEDEAEPDPAEIGDVPPEAVPFYGALAPEGVQSGDGRKFAVDALRWRDLPLPLAWQEANNGGHDGSIIVGNIEQIWRKDGIVYGSGHMLTTVPQVDQVVGMMAEGGLRGVSVDADDGTMQFEREDGSAISMDDELSPDERVVTVFTSARVCGATLCAIPAFQEAFIALGETPEELLPVPESGTEDEEEILLTVDAESGEITVLSEDAATFVKTEDGPGWLTHPVDTDRLRDYWTRGKGAAKIAWGMPGDFNRCRTHLAKYIKPQHLSGYCANRHYDALGFWPGNHRGKRGMTSEAIAAAVESGEVMAPSISLVASGEPFRPPAEWFSNPNLTGPSPLVVTEDGRVFGHLAEWDVCHIGISGVCTVAPHSTTDYAFFRTGAIIADSGEHIPVGQLTIGTGHADIRSSAKVAMAHYDNTGFAAADVAAGEDEFGIWVAGAVRPWATEEQVHALRAAKLSGDWREVAEGLELVGALAVNVPGFPIPRTAIAASGGRQTALVAAGIVTSVPLHTDEGVEQIVMRVLQREQARQRIAQIAAATGKDPVSRIKRLAAARERNH